MTEFALVDDVQVGLYVLLGVLLEAVRVRAVHAVVQVLSRAVRKIRYEIF